MSNRRKARRPRFDTHPHIPPVVPDQGVAASLPWAREHVLRCDFMPPGRGIDDCGRPAAGWIEVQTPAAGLWQAFGYCSEHGGALASDMLMSVGLGGMLDVRCGGAFSEAGPHLQFEASWH